MSTEAWTSLKERGSPLLIRLIIRLTLSLGWWLGQFLLYPITAYYFAVLPRTRGVSRRYLRRALGREPTQADVWRHFFTYSSVILDRICFLADRTAGFRVRVSGLEHLAAVVQRGRGCLLFGAHFGSFEALRTFRHKSPVPVRVLMYRGTTGALSTFFEALDPTLGKDVIEIGNPDAMLRVRESLGRGEIVGILADRAPESRRSAMVEFLGEAAPFPTGPVLLAAALGAPVVLFFGLLRGPRNYEIVLEPFADCTALRREDARAVAAVVGRYADRLSAHCRANPYNWFNFYDFWQSGRSKETGRPAVDAVRSSGPANRLARSAPSSGARSGAFAAESGGVRARLQPSRRNLLVGLGLAGALPLIFRGAWAQARSAAPIDELMRRLAAVPERRASFIEEKTLAALATPVRSEGWLVYRRPGHLEKTTTRPQPESLVVDGDRLLVELPDASPRLIDLDGEPALRGLVEAVRGTLAGDLPGLRRFYDVAMQGSLNAWRLVLRPRGKPLSDILREIVVDGAGIVLSQIFIVQTNGDQSRMTIRPIP